MFFLCKSGFTLVISFSLVSLVSLVSFIQLHSVFYIKMINAHTTYINRQVAVSILFIMFEISQIIHIMLTRLYCINIEIC